MQSSNTTKLISESLDGPLALSRSLEDLKQFRQWGSKTPGHPEYGLTPGLETTTGPRQDFLNGIGMAMAEAHLAALFNREGFDVVNH